MPSVGRKPANEKSQRHSADAGGDTAALRAVRGGLPGTLELYTVSVMITLGIFVLVVLLLASLLRAGK